MKKRKEMNNNAAQIRDDDIWINEATGEYISEREISFWLYRFAKRLAGGIVVAMAVLDLAVAFVVPYIEQAISKYSAERLQATERSSMEDASLLPTNLDEVSGVVKSSDSAPKSLSERFYDHELLDYVCCPKIKIRTSGSENTVSANGSRVVFNPDVEYYITFDYRKGLAEDEKFRGTIQVDYPTFVPEGQIGFIRITAYDYEHERYSLGEIEVYARDSRLCLQHSAGVTIYSWSDFVKTYDEDGRFGFSLYAADDPLAPISGRMERDTITSVGGVVTYEICNDVSDRLVSTVIPQDEVGTTVIELDGVHSVSELRDPVSADLPSY